MVQVVTIFVELPLACFFFKFVDHVVRSTSSVKCEICVWRVPTSCPDSTLFFIRACHGGENGIPPLFAPRGPGVVRVRSGIGERLCTCFMAVRSSFIPVSNHQAFGFEPDI